MFALSPVLVVLRGNSMEQNELAPVGLSIFATKFDDRINFNAKIGRKTCARLRMFPA